MKKKQTWLLALGGVSLGFFIAWLITRPLPAIIADLTERISQADTLNLKRQLRIESEKIRREAEREWQQAIREEANEPGSRKINDEVDEEEGCLLDGSACDREQKNQLEKVIVPPSRIEGDSKPTLTHCLGSTCPS